MEDEKVCKKCSNGGVIIKPDGENELDPCVYVEEKYYKNVTVVISRCKYCGAIDIGWLRQENTVEIDENGDVIDDSPFAEK